MIIPPKNFGFLCCFSCFKTLTEGCILPSGFSCQPCQRCSRGIRVTPTGPPPQAAKICFLTESLPHINRIHRNNGRAHSWDYNAASTVTIQLGPDWDLCVSQLVKLKDIAVTSGGETHPLPGTRPIVCRTDNGWCNRLQWIKVHTHTYTQIRSFFPHHSSCVHPPERVFFMLSNLRAVTSLWQPLLTVTPLWVQKRLPPRPVFWRSFLNDNALYAVSLPRFDGSARGGLFGLRDVTEDLWKLWKSSYWNVVKASWWTLTRFFFRQGRFFHWNNFFTS